MTRHRLPARAMAPGKKKTARITPYAPPPYPGTSKRSPIDVDAEENVETNLRCTVIVREARIRKLARQVDNLKKEVAKEREARDRELADLEEDLASVKNLNAALIIERDTLRSKLDRARDEMYGALEALS
ncbi:uncharacterized protein SCHCODRAFT_01172436 [Schizophyllum commune H4-8]|nr:uncharacterized protein SCHCODRAFT_01172436 [Schizophyllum commune H4-8]KAI5891522.1 hypothetical protein SCHCODRAFT_01172436 [Schizophyllum commune H4-8]